MNTYIWTLSLGGLDNKTGEYGVCVVQADSTDGARELIARQINDSETVVNLVGERPAAIVYDNGYYIRGNFEATLSGQPYRIIGRWSPGDD
jgi:hypothetical protein